MKHGTSAMRKLESVAFPPEGVTHDYRTYQTPVPLLSEKEAQAILEMLDAIEPLSGGMTLREGFPHLFDDEED